MDNQEQIRLQVYMARSGLGSRRACEKLIEEGRVTLNGEVITSQGEKVGPEDRVYFDGRLIKPMARKIYLALHKPSGYICSNHDPDGRPLAKDLFETAVPQRMFNVGRLDYMTSGLIFFTNDGEFARAMTHPSCHLEKEYVITTKKPIPKELMDSFLKGMTVEGEYFRCKEYQIISDHKVKIILEEGKNRELRKVFQSRNITIKKVHRLRIGPITLQGLQPGRFRFLQEKDVERLMTAASEKGARHSSARSNSSRDNRKPFDKKQHQSSFKNGRTSGGRTSGKGRKPAAGKGQGKRQGKGDFHGNRH